MNLFGDFSPLCAAGRHCNDQPVKHEKQGKQLWFPAKAMCVQGLVFHIHSNSKINYKLSYKTVCGIEINSNFHKGLF